jgi:hypothetical protein
MTRARHLSRKLALRNSLPKLAFDLQSGAKPRLRSFDPRSPPEKPDRTSPAFGNKGGALWLRGVLCAAAPSLANWLSIE